jgi:CheY-like chemotaxis protein
MAREVPAIPGCGTTELKMKSSETRTPCILVADDQADVLEALRFLIKGEGYQAVAVNSPPAVIQEVETRDFDAVLMDLNYTRDTTSGQEGLELLNRIQLLDTTLPVIVMTAWGSVELAVEAMRRFSKRRSNSGAPCAKGSGSKRRTGRCARSDFRN